MYPTLVLLGRRFFNFSIVKPGWLGIVCAMACLAGGLHAEAPQVTQHLRTQLVLAGSNVTFQVEVGEGAVPSYQWTHNGEILSGETGSSLSLMEVGRDAEGWYRVEASGTDGSVTSVAHLHVAPENGGAIAWGHGDGDWLRVIPEARHVMAVDAGISYNLAVVRDGTVVAWGYTGRNGHGQTDVPPDLDRVVAVAAGPYHALALRDDGTVVAWGGDNSPPEITTVPSDLIDVVAIGAGGNESVALKADGTVVEWGQQFVPTPAAATDIVSISVVHLNNYAVKSDGTALTWGNNRNGEATLPEDLGPVRWLSGGEHHSLAIKLDGAIRSWGVGIPGSLEVPDDLSAARWTGGGRNYSLALTTAGSVAGWGSFAIPSETVGKTWDIGAGYEHAIALVETKAPEIVLPPRDVTAEAGSDVRFDVLADGLPPLIYRWLRDGEPVPEGPRYEGQETDWLSLDNITAEDAGEYVVEVTNAVGTTTTVPVQLRVGRGPEIVSAPLTQLVTVGDALNWEVNATGVEPLRYQWKRNGRVIPEATTAIWNIPEVVRADADVYQIEVIDAEGASATRLFELRVTEHSFDRTTAVSWGSIYSGLPVTDIRHFADVVKLASAPRSSSGVVMALNTSGELGIATVNESVARQAPTEIGAVATMAAGGGYLWASDVKGGLWQWRADGTEVNYRSQADIASFVVTESYALGIRDDGRILILGGYYTDGVQENLPQYIPGLVELVLAPYGPLAVLEDGSVRHYTNNSGAPQIPAELAEVVSVSAGNAHMLALRNDGSVMGWGNNYSGQIDVPDGLVGVVEVHANSNGSFALLADGTLRTWGENNLNMFDVPPLDSPILDFSIGYFAGFALIEGTELNGLEVSAPVETVAAGTTAEFVVTVTGSAPFVYQWFKDGVALAGETAATLSLVNVQASDIADYTVRISNALGQILSAPFALNVSGDSSPPQLRKGWTSTSAWADEPVELSSTVVGSVPLQHQWFFGSLGDDSHPVENGDTATLVDNSETSGGLWLRSTNAAGQLDSSEGVLMRWAEEETGIAEEDDITVAYANGRFFALNDYYGDEAAYSTAAGRWIPVDSVGASPIEAVVYGFGRYIAPTRTRYNRAEYCTSLDGIHWVDVDLPEVGVTFSAMAFNGVRFIALVNDGQVFSSTDGISWVQVHQLGDFSSGELMVDDQAGFVYTGRSGYVARSPDGLSWTEKRIAGNPSLHIADFGNGRIVAIEIGYANVSTDGGETWTRHALPDLPESYGAQTGVAYGAGVWIAVQGRHVLHSLDGKNWTATHDFFPAPLDYNSSFSSVTYGNGEFILTGQEEPIFRSLPLRDAVRGIGLSQRLGVAAGESTELVITPSGPAQSYQWYQGGTGDTSRLLVGATSRTFVTPALTESTRYWVRVVGAVDSVNSGTFNVIVATPPEVVKSPQSREGVVGQRLELEFEVTSESPLSFQWFEGEAGDESRPIAGATMATYVLAPTELTRTYWARASNAAGMVDSETATVTIWKVFNGHRAARDMVEFKGRWYAADYSVMVSDNGRGWEVSLGNESSGFSAQRLVVRDGVLMAGGTGGIWQTRDGVQWEKVSYGGSAYTGYGGNIAFGAGVWVNTFSDIRWSVDGEEWSYIDGSPDSIRQIIFADDRFVAVGFDSTSIRSGSVYTSFDGKSWKERSPSLLGDHTELMAVAHGAPGFVAVGAGGAIIKSNDALSWTDVSPAGASELEFTSVAWGAERFVAGVAGSNTVWWSEDGANWQEATGPVKLSSDRVFFIDGRFRAEGASGWAYESPDGVNWELVSGWPGLGTAYSQNIDDPVPGLAAGNGLFMLLGSNQALVFVSSDGVDWREASSPGSYSNELTHFGDWFIVSSSIGDRKGLRISRDGMSWETVLTLAETEGVNRFVRTDNGLVAITNLGRIFRSADGVHWEQDPYSLPFNPNTFASAGSRFIMTDWRSVYVSSDLAHWAPVEFPFSLNRFDGAAYGNGRFVLGTQFIDQVYSSNDGIHWVDSLQDPSGGAEELVFVDGRFLALERSNLKSSEDGRSWRADPEWYAALGQVDANGRFPDQRVATLGNITLVAGGTHLAISRRDPAVGGILSANGSQIVTEGSPIRFTVEAVGQDLAYQWYRGEAGDTSQPISQGTSAVLEIPSDEVTGAAVFWVRVTSGAQSWSSESLPVQVFAAPVIVTHPVGQEVPLTGTITLRVAATGADTLHYQWWRNGSRVPDSDTTELLLDAAGDVGGEYLAVAYNEFGATASESTFLVIPDAPEIVTEPVDLTVTVGASATFTVEAQGLSLLYQWRRNGVDLPGETGTELTLSQVGGTDAGTYDVVVRNRGGLIISAPARLTVEGGESLSPAFVGGVGLINSSGNGGVVHLYFRIDGTGSKRVLLRNLGPGMNVNGDPENTWVRDPHLTLRDRTGRLIVTNDNWNEAEDEGEAVRLANLEVGALPLGEGSLDAALVVELPPGTYSMEVNWRGAGKSVPEVWDLDSLDEPTSRLASMGLFSRILSGYIRPSLSFVVPPPGGREIVSRHLGPALERDDAMGYPRLQLYSGGSSPAVIGSAIGWDASTWPTWLLAGLRGVPLALNASDSMRVDRLSAGVYQLEGIGSSYDRGFGLLEVIDPLGTASPPEMAVLVPARSQVVLAGYNVRLDVLVEAPRGRVYQWNLNGQPVAGAVSASLLLEEVKPEWEGDYTLTVSAGGDALTTEPVEVKVLGGGPVRATQSIAARVVVMGETAVITAEIEWDDSPIDMGYRVELPEGWAYESDDAVSAVDRPEGGATGRLDWRFGSLTGSGVMSFTYVIRVPEEAERYNSIAGEVIHTDLSGSEIASEALPYPLGVVALAGIHDADTDGDRRMNLSELLRAIELYNTRFGSARTGRYRPAESTVDGFEPDDSSDKAATLTRYHSGDTDRNGRFSLSELLRVIEIYNTRTGSTRTGAYRESENTDDGFEPDP